MEKLSLCAHIFTPVKALEQSRRFWMTARDSRGPERFKLLPKRCRRVCCKHSPFFCGNLPWQTLRSPTFANDFTTIPYRRFFITRVQLSYRKFLTVFFYVSVAITSRWNQVHSPSSRINLEVYKEVKLYAFSWPWDKIYINELETWKYNDINLQVEYRTCDFSLGHSNYNIPSWKLFNNIEILFCRSRGPKNPLTNSQLVEKRSRGQRFRRRV